MITGAGKAFSAGYDIGAIPDENFEQDAEALVAHPFTAAMDAISAHPFPVVAAINGHCLGGGLELAVRCDLRICAAEAKLGMPPAKLGLIYGHTGLERFIDCVGVPRTKELFLTGRVMSGERAERIGLVHEVRPPPRSRPNRSRSHRRSRPMRRSPLAATSMRSRRSRSFPGSAPNRSMSWSRSANRASRPRTSERASGPSPRSGTPNGKVVEEGSVTISDPLAELAEKDPRIARLIAEVDAELIAERRSERTKDRFQALARIIVGQQVSTAAARTVWGRVVDEFGGSVSPIDLIAPDAEERLRGCGLSGRKAAYMIGIAEAIESGALRPGDLDELTDEEVIEALVALKGIGRWSAEMFLIFDLGRPDVFSGGDLGLRKGIQIVYELEEMPTPEEAVAIAASWTPHRSLASLYLWEAVHAAPR